MKNNETHLFPAYAVIFTVFALAACLCALIVRLASGAAEIALIIFIMLILCATFIALFTRFYRTTVNRLGASMKKITEAFPEDEREALRLMSGDEFEPMKAAEYICESLRKYEQDDILSRQIRLSVNNSREIFWFIRGEKCEFFCGDYWNRHYPSNSLGTVKDLRDLFSEDSRAELAAAVKQACASPGSSFSLSSSMEISQTNFIRVRIRGKSALQDDGTSIVYGTVRSVQSETILKNKLQGEQIKSAFLLEMIQDVIYEVDVESNTLKSLNPEMSKALFGIEDMGDFDSERRPYWELIHPDYREGFVDRFFNYNHMLAMPERKMSFEYRVKNKNGDYIWVEHTAQVLRTKNGAVTEVIGRISDIDKRKLAEADKVKTTDGITGGMVKSAVVRGYDDPANAKGKRCLVLFNINGFHNINNEYGFKTGDELFRQIMLILWSKQRGSCLVGRFNADMFAIAMLDVNQHNDPVLQMTRVLDAFLDPIKINGRTINISLRAACSEAAGEGGSFSAAYEQAAFALKLCARQNHSHSNSYLKYDDTLRIENPDLWEETIEEISKENT